MPFIYKFIIFVKGIISEVKRFKILRHVSFYAILISIVLILSCTEQQNKELEDELFVKFELELLSDSDSLQISLKDYDLQKTLIDSAILQFPLNLSWELPLNSYKYGRIIGLKNSSSLLILTNSYDKSVDTTSLPSEEDTLKFNFKNLKVFLEKY